MTLVLCAHGTRSELGRASIRSMVAAVAAAVDEPVLEAYVDVHGPTLAEVLRPGATVVPLFLATGYHVRVDIAGAAQRVPQVTVAAPLGPSPLLADLLVSRLESSGLRAEDAVVLGAAGSSDDRSAQAAEVTARSLAERLGRAVPVAYGASRRPSVAEHVAALRASGARRVAVASYLLAPGHFHRVLLASGADLVSTPLVIPGEAVDPGLVRLVVERTRQARRSSAA